MLDKPYFETKKRIKVLFDSWVEVLGLRWWKINVDWYDDTGQFPTAGQNGFSAVGQADVQWPYREATISFNVPHMVDMSDDQLEQVVIHELMHVIVNEMRDDTESSIKHEERVCSSLSFAFQSVKEKYAKKPRVRRKR